MFNMAYNIALANLALPDGAATALYSIATSAGPQREALAMES
jgi:hypothetical protein